MRSINSRFTYLLSYLLNVDGVRRWKNDRIILGNMGLWGSCEAPLRKRFCPFVRPTHRRCHWRGRCCHNWLDWSSDIRPTHPVPTHSLQALISTYGDFVWLCSVVVSALGIPARCAGFESRVAPLFHWVATLGKLFTHIAFPVSQLQETGVKKGVLGA